MHCWSQAGPFGARRKRAHEWPRNAAADAEETRGIVRDAVGNVLQDGDTVTVIKDLKVKGSSSVVKVGTKVKNIRL